MKKILSLILAALMCAFVFTACSKDKEGGESDTSAPAKKLVIGYTLYEPMNYEDENGKLVGFDTEFAEAVCKKLGYEPVFQLIDWGNKYLELSSGAIDCIWNGFTANCADDDGIQRTDKVDISYYYMNNEQCVVVKTTDLDKYSTAESLAGKKVAAENGSAGEGVAKDLAGDSGEFLGVTSQMNTLTELMSGAVDFVVIDKTMAKSIVGKGDYTSLSIASSIEIEAEKYAIGFSKGSELTAQVNSAIKELAADGTLASLAEKYGLSNYLITDYEG